MACGSRRARAPVALGLEESRARPQALRRAARRHRRSPAEAHQEQPAPDPPDPQRRRLPAVHQRLHPDLRQAHAVFLAARFRGFQHPHVALPGGHRRRARHGRRVHGSASPGEGRAGRPRRRPQAHRSHRCRQPGRQPSVRRHRRLAHRRGGGADPRSQGRAGAAQGDGRRAGRHGHACRQDRPRRGEARRAGRQPILARPAPRRPHATHRRGHGADLLHRLQGAARGRPQLHEHDARRRPADRGIEGRGHRRADRRSAQQRRRLVAGSGGTGRPVRGFRPGRAGVESAPPAGRLPRSRRHRGVERPAGGDGERPLRVGFGDLRRRGAGLRGSAWSSAARPSARAPCRA